jgi:glycosyltransferase involved in cell wall biosynthesis
MKIAWLGHVASARANGMVSYSHEMMAGLRQRGQDVTFFYHMSRERRFVQREPTGIRIGSFDILNRAMLSSNNARQTIEDVVEQKQIDVAHISLSFSQLDFSLPDICHELGIPAIATLHFPYGPPETFWGSAVRVLYRIYSEKQGELLVDYGVAPERVRVIPNGVDIATFAPGPSDYKEHIGAAVLSAYIGRVDPEKNVKEFLKAFHKLDPPFDHKAIVVGNGMDLAQLRRKYRDDPRIIFTGYIGELRERIRILRAADIFVLPSSIEGLSLAMLEAMAAGTAIIATDVGADAEALHGAGIVIDLVDMAEQLPLALRTLFDFPDFRRDLAVRARQRAVNTFSLETNIDRVVDLYRELVGK